MFPVCLKWRCSGLVESACQSSPPYGNGRNNKVDVVDAGSPETWFDAWNVLGYNMTLEEKHGRRRPPLACSAAVFLWYRLAFDIVTFPL